MALHLDHIIILVPYVFLQSPPSWLASNFTVTPGGRHADGKTENILVCFQDGFYIEFIAFVNDDPAHREGHWWGTKQYGIIDFALTSRTDNGPVLFSKLEERISHLNLGEGTPKIQYRHPVEGGRVRPDGREIGWHVTFPVVDSGYQRGELPFFCTDLTPREFRAPLSKESTTHPNGAYGVDELYVFVPEERAIALTQAYSAILGVANSVSEEDPNFLGTFDLERLNEVTGTDRPVVVIGMPLEEEQSAAMDARGGALLANLTLGSMDESKGLLKRIDIGGEGVGGIVAPVILEKNEERQLRKCSRQTLCSYRAKVQVEG